MIGGSSDSLIRGGSHGNYVLDEEADNVDPLQDLQFPPSVTLKVGILCVTSSSAEPNLVSQLQGTVFVLGISANVNLLCFLLATYVPTIFMPSEGRRLPSRPSPDHPVAAMPI